MDDVVPILIRGAQSLEWLAVLLARVGVGAMFAISGWHKLFLPERRRLLLETLTRTGIPCVHLQAPAVAATELVAGMLLVVGLLTPAASAALLVIVVVAIVTVSAPDVDADRPPNWLENFLYLPEFLYLLLLVWLVTTGAGPVSVDSLI
jgi:putative oxidoreductase